MMLAPKTNKPAPTKGAGLTNGTHSVNDAPALAQARFVAVANEQAARGWFVFPCDPQNKRPMPGIKWREVSTIDADALDAWGRRWPQAMVGIDCGKSGLLVVDVDAGDGKQGMVGWHALLACHAPGGLKAPMVCTQRHGLHVYFQNPTGHGNTRQGMPEHIDLRGVGGYVIAPGSEGSHGWYRWTHSPEQTGGLSEPPQWLLALLACPVSTKDAGRGAGWATCVGGDALLDRAGQYLAALPSAVSGAGGHAATMWAARCLVWGFGLSKDQARPLLDAYNQRCCPPWKPGELEHKLEQAASTPFDKPRGWLLADDVGGNDAPRVSMPVGQPLAWRPFPVALLPEVVARYVSESATAIGCDPAYVATPMLAGLASAIGMTRRLALKQSWKEPCILWTAVVGDSGTMKSPAMDWALKPIRDTQRRFMREHQQAMASFEAAMDAHKSEARKGRGNTNPPPHMPVCKRLWTDDATIESLASILQDNPRGVLCAKDELAGWLGGFDRYTQAGGGDVPRWLSMHGGRDLIVDRKTSGTVCVSHAAVGVTGGIQPGILAQSLTDAHAESGLKARLLLVNPPRRPKRWTNADLGEATSNRMANVYAQLLHLVMGENDAGEAVPLDVGMDAEAEALWVPFYNQHAKETVGESGELAAAFSKLEGAAARLALVLHLTRWAGCEPVNPEKVDATSMANAIALTRWWCHETRRVYALLQGSRKDRQAMQLVDLIQAKGGGKATARDLQQWRRKDYAKAEQAKQALVDLAASGWGTWEPVPIGTKGGHPSFCFTLHTDTQHTT